MNEVNLTKLPNLKLLFLNKLICINELFDLLLFS